MAGLCLIAGIVAAARAPGMYYTGAVAAAAVSVVVRCRTNEPEF